MSEQPSTPVRRILNRHRHQSPGGYVRVDRDTFLGNPFPITPSRSREQAIRAYAAWFTAQWRKAAFRKRVRAYVKTPETALMCYCAPLPCHAEVIREFVDGGPPARIADR